MNRVYKSQNGLGWYEWIREDGIKCIELSGEGILTEEATSRYKAEFLGTDDWRKLVATMKVEGKLKDQSGKSLEDYAEPFEILAQESCNIYLPNEGDVLSLFGGDSEEEELENRLFLVFRKKAIAAELCVAAWEGLRNAARPSRNRGVAGGRADVTKFSRKDITKILPIGDGTRARYITKEGYLSKTVEANTTMGGIAGYFPSAGRNPYARATSYTRDNWETFQKSWPFLEAMAKIFKDENPSRFAVQMGFIRLHKLDVNGWVVPNTPYSTITVNKNFQTATHQDAGDLKSGLENMAVLEGGPDKYVGGYTVFPQFRLAFDARMGDFVGMDVAHYWHGNTPILPAEEGKEDYERVSLVVYVREDFAGVGTQAEEEAKRNAWHNSHRSSIDQYAFRTQEFHAENADEAALYEFGGVTSEET